MAGLSSQPIPPGRQMESSLQHGGAPKTSGESWTMEFSSTSMLDTTGRSKEYYLLYAPEVSTKSLSQFRNSLCSGVAKCCSPVTNMGPLRYKDIVPSLPVNPEDSSSEIPLLPKDVLNILSNQLGHRGHQLTAGEDVQNNIKQSLLLLKFLIIICRNLENIEVNKTPGFLFETLRLLKFCIDETNALVAITSLAADDLLGILGSWCNPSNLEPRDPQLLQLSLQCLIAMIHILHGSSLDQRRVEIRTILDSYFRVLNSDWPATILDTEQRNTLEEQLVTLRTSMLNAIPEMLNCADRPVLQAIFLNNNCFEHILRLIQNSKLYLNSRCKKESDGACDLATQLLTEIDIDQEVFKERIGYSHLYDVLLCQGQPSRQLLQELMNMAVEGDHSQIPLVNIKNEQPLLLLVQWLPELTSCDLQIIVSSWLSQACGSSLHGRLTAVKAGLVAAVLETLSHHQRLNRKCADNLISLLQSLGAISLRPEELKRLLLLLKPPSISPEVAHPYCGRVIRALSSMADQDEKASALQYFDLSHSMAGIMVPTIQRWPGNGFAFHAWLCLSAEPKHRQVAQRLRGAQLRRKQLYSFFTGSGTGFEAFFTTDGMLVVAVCTKKDYMTIALSDFTFTDCTWSFTSCCIGSAGHRTTTTRIALCSPVLTPEPLFLSHAPPLSRSQSFPASVMGSPMQNSLVHTIPAGNQDMEWGTPTSLEGMLGTAFVCHDTLQPSQIKALHSAGPNNVYPFKADGELAEVISKVLLYYTPKACKDHICYDLSLNHQYDGRLTGHKVTNWNVKDVINCVGGMAVLLPLLEQMAWKSEDIESYEETTELLGPELTASQNTPGILLPLGKPTEERLEKNTVAAFLLMVKNFLRNDPINQESLVQCHGPAIIGALLQKMPSTLLDMNVLMACQVLMEQASNEGNSVLLQHLYQHILFDFRIWSQSDFAVRLGHIQNLSSVIKDHKQRIRRKYGVQYILDSIRTYYGAEKEGTVPADDVRTVQTTLFSLVKDFLSKGVTNEELQCALSYATAVGDEQQVCGILEVIHNLLRGSPSKEQLFSVLFDTGNIEALYSLLLQKKYSDDLRERVFKILYKILKYDKVPERSKHRLKLKDIGYQGLICYLNEITVSMSLIRCLCEQVLAADNNPNYRDLLAVVFLSHRADLTVRLDICRKLFHLIYSNHENVHQLSRQASWQDTLTKLYIKESYESRADSLSSSLDLRNQNGMHLCRQDSNTPDLLEDQHVVMGDITDSVFLPFTFEHSDIDISEGFSDLSLSPSNNFPSCTLKSYGNSMNFKSFDSLDRASHSSSNTIDIPGAADCCQHPEEDSLYHPLSPFGMSPFELGLELASSGSIATVESGNQTPVSQVDTPSPLETFKPFPGMQVRKSSSLSNVLDESSYQEPLPGDNTSNTSNPQQTPEEELCNLLTNIIFSVMWRGVEGSDDAAWKERGQVFSVLTKLGSSWELIRAPDEIKRSLLEMMLESAFSDIKDSSTPVLLSNAQNVIKLLRLLQDFLFAEGHSNQALWSEKIFEGVVNLLDKMQAWYFPVNGTNDSREMAQIGLRIITGYIQQQNSQICAMACVKLHSLLQTVLSLHKEEVCFLLGRLSGPLCQSLTGGRTDTFTYLVPIIHPAVSYYELETFGRSHDLMSNFWNSCFDALMSSSLRREKEREESKLKFQELFVDTYLKKMRSENLRYSNMLKQVNSHHITVFHQWKSIRRLVSCERGAWAERPQLEMKLKLSSAETYSKMRLKLVPNYNFDSHADASALRDNMGAENLHSHTDTIPLAVAKEAKVRDMADDQLEEEDLVFLDNQVEVDEQNQKEKLVISEDCELITIVAVIQGRLEVTTHHIYFYDGSPEKKETEEGIGYDFKRPLSQLREVHLRRYNLRRSALEFFFIDQAHYFINFRTKVRNKVYTRILGLRPSNLFYFGSRSPQELLKASGLTQKWVFREISNFEYLMQLNTIAGRTYNDLSQYPVFPWILCDYSSDTLDLDNPSVFRDLSKPIGVVNSRHAKEVKEKYESFEDPTGMTDKFHYGTHYSNSAGVIHYMIRAEPFTTLHIQLQSGRFDCADRQFHSIQAAWQARMENPVDVKELIPEFFYFPEFLKNMNDFDLGCLQMSQDKVNNVVLPKWADSPEDFIRKHRNALESEYVSAHLHEWIDLIFGYKQRGPDAVEALNVFYYCTYEDKSYHICMSIEGAVDLDAIADETERKALEGMISNFGQTPCQLLKVRKIFLEPHPKRLTAENAARRQARHDTIPPNLFDNLSQLKAFVEVGVHPLMLQDLPFLIASNEHLEISQKVNVKEISDILMYIVRDLKNKCIVDGVPLVQAVVPKNQARTFMTQTYHDILVTVCANGLIGTHSWQSYDKNIANYFSFNRDPTISNPNVELSSKILVVSHDGKLLFSGGHWDNSLRVTSLSKGKVIGQILRHIDIVTCLAIDLFGIYLISGSRDTTCMVWQVQQQGGFASGLAPKPVQVLYGHDDEVTCVAISTELDMAVLGSKDKNHLHLYSVNGQLLASVPSEEQATALCLSQEHVILGTAQGSLHIRDLYR
ncbi:NBEL2 protein, partial [Polypterus senegalus]